jgi:hypothetical protein
MALLSNQNRRVCFVAAPLFMAALVFLSGCKQTTPQVDDPQLKPIQAILETNVPIGTPEGAVNQFLERRGYTIVNAEKPGTIVAIIRHIDTETVRPVTARVTFYFDANGKLNTYEIVRTMNAPIPQ